MMQTILSFFGDYLIEFMTFMVFGALGLRLVIFKNSRNDEAYFSQFTRELNAMVDYDKEKGVDTSDPESYLTNILGRVNSRLPDRILRSNDSKRRLQSQTLKDYVGSKHGLIASIQSESSVFNSKVPPNWSQLTERIMNEDQGWTKVFGVIDIGIITRVLDMLPSMFIIFGVFGTFIGISLALPEIAKIDFSNLQTSGETLTQFVVNVTFAMKTSVAGIAFSIVLTVLNTIFPSEEMRERTFDKVETSLQILWYHIQKDQTKESRPEILMGQIVSKLQELIDINKKDITTKPSPKKEAA